MKQYESIIFYAKKRFFTDRTAKRKSNSKYKKHFKKSKNTFEKLNWIN